MRWNPVVQQPLEIKFNKKYLKRWRKIVNTAYKRGALPDVSSLQLAALLALDTVLEQKTMYGQGKTKILRRKMQFPHTSAVADLFGEMWEREGAQVQEVHTQAAEIRQSVTADYSRLNTRCARLQRLRELNGPPFIISNEERMIGEAIDAYFTTLHEIVALGDGKITVHVPREEYVTLAGFEIVLLGHDPNNPVDRDYIQMLVSALEHFRERIDTLSNGWLYQWVVPLIVQFPEGVADVQSYRPDDNRVVGGHAGGLLYIGRYPRTRQGRERLIGLLAHELAHRLYFDWLETYRWLDLYESYFHDIDDDYIDDDISQWHEAVAKLNFDPRALWALSRWEQIWQEIPTEYGQTDEIEAFAEAFNLLFVAGPRALPPNMRAFFQQYLSHVRVNPARSNPTENFYHCQYEKRGDIANEDTIGIGEWKQASAEVTGLRMKEDESDSGADGNMRQVTLNEILAAAKNPRLTDRIKQIRRWYTQHYGRGTRNWDKYWRKIYPLRGENDRRVRYSDWTNVWPAWNGFRRNVYRTLDEFGIKWIWVTEGYVWTSSLICYKIRIDPRAILLKKRDMNTKGYVYVYDSNIAVPEAIPLSDNEARKLSAEKGRPHRRL